MGYLTRRPTLNDLPKLVEQGKSPWLIENEFLDEFALLLSGCARRCKRCQRATSVEYLKEEICPGCR